MDLALGEEKRLKGRRGRKKINLMMLVLGLGIRSWGTGEMGTGEQGGLGLAVQGCWGTGTTCRGLGKQG